MRRKIPAWVWVVGALILVYVYSVSRETVIYRIPVGGGSLTDTLRLPENVSATYYALNLTFLLTLADVSPILVAPPVQSYDALLVGALNIHNDYRAYLITVLGSAPEATGILINATGTASATATYDPSCGAGSYGSSVLLGIGRVSIRHSSGTVFGTGTDPVDVYSAGSNRFADFVNVEILRQSRIVDRVPQSDDPITTVSGSAELLAWVNETQFFSPREETHFLVWTNATYVEGTCVNSFAAPDAPPTITVELPGAGEYVADLVVSLATTESALPITAPLFTLPGEHRDDLITPDFNHSVNALCGRPTNLSACTLDLTVTSPLQGGDIYGAVLANYSDGSSSYENNTCTPAWTTGSWGACSNGTQTRSVTDGNSCGVATGKPATSQSCTQTCTPNWQCGNWSVCEASNQTRTCTDTKACLNPSPPTTTQTCEMKGWWVTVTTTLNAMPLVIKLMAGVTGLLLLANVAKDRGWLTRGRRRRSRL